MSDNITRGERILGWDSVLHNLEQLDGGSGNFGIWHPQHLKL